MRNGLATSGIWPALSFALALGALAASGCGNTRRQSPLPSESDVGGASDSSVGGSGSGGTAGTLESCTGPEVPVPKRLVRLSFTQIAKAVASLTNDVDGRRLVEPFEVVGDQHRTFPPLAGVREGSAYTSPLVEVIDGLAAAVGQHAVDHVATFTNCGTDPSEACVRRFVADFAERAYRRPCTADENESLLQVVTSAISVGETPTEALRYGVQAVLFSPHFLYRTEFGDDSLAPGPLAPHELAAALSFFITDAPPDAELLEAARQDELSTAAQVAAHAKRLLATPAARKNLEDAMFSNFGLGTLESVVIAQPEFTQALRNSMRLESERFLANTLWSGPLTTLLTSRQSSIDASLASIYGLPAFPTAGERPDAEGFALTELPDDRAGILTQPGFLAARARPDGPSVIARGFLVRSAITCLKTPPFPEGIAETAVEMNPELHDLTEREQAEYRASTAPCAACHTLSDAYGLVLDTFDNIGRFRRLDDRGRPIDPVVALPAFVGGEQVSSAAEMARVLAGSGRFETCMAERFLHWALAEVPSTGDAGKSLTIEGCAARAIVHRFRETEQTFEDLLLQIAASDTLSRRVAGQEAP